MTKTTTYKKGSFSISHQHNMAAPIKPNSLTIAFTLTYDFKQVYTFKKTKGIFFYDKSCTRETLFYLSTCLRGEKHGC